MQRGRGHLHIRRGWLDRCGAGASQLRPPWPGRRLHARTGQSGRRLGRLDGALPRRSGESGASAMKATVLFRITAVLFVIFAAGHTFGFLTFKPPTEAAVAVHNSLNNVYFKSDGKIFSYGGFYRGLACRQRRACSSKPFSPGIWEAWLG